MRSLVDRKIFEEQLRKIDMKNFKEIDFKSIKEDMVSKIAEEWMLISAGNSKSFNTMTASWGGVGFMFNRHVAIVAVRPQRHTFGFIENNERMTLTFFGKGNQREALALCGSKSGRDCDKVKEAGLNAVFTDAGNPTFAEAELVIEGRKIFAQDWDEQSFFDQAILDKWFSAKDFHKMYIIEIEKVLVKE